jgi:hypothetical protein
MRHGNKNKDRQARSGEVQSSGQYRSEPSRRQTSQAGSERQWGYDPRDRGQQEQFEPQRFDDESGQRNFRSGEDERGSGSDERGYRGGLGNSPWGNGGNFGNDERGFRDRYESYERGFGGNDSSQRDYGRGNEERNQRGFGPGSDSGSGRGFGGYDRGDRGFGGSYGNRERSYGNRYGSNEPTYGSDYRSGERSFGGRLGTGESGNDRGYGNTANLGWSGQGWSQNEGRGPKNYRRSDERIREEVCDRLMQGRLNAEEVDVQVQDGQVTLSGTVEDRQDKRIIEELAEQILGVKDVQNQLRVQRPTSSSRSEKPSGSGAGSQVHGEGNAQKSSKA